jgi:coenzyme F420-0:L-glutamate ligase / coenzyme F420-1:gamma-L-glutamate ligase
MKKSAQDEPLAVTTADPVSAQFVALAGVPLVKPGDDLTGIVLAALAASGEKLRDGDVLVLAQKIVSKAQGRMAHLHNIEPSARAKRLSDEVNKDARLVELILRESTEVIRHRRDLLIVAHRLGFIMANAGIDFSNVELGGGDETALLLPENPDRVCAELRAAMLELAKADVGVIINDSHGRAFRNGSVGVAIGASGLTVLANLRGDPDLYGRRLRHTEVALADEIASAASLLMGQAAEGRPIVLARGVRSCGCMGNAASLVRAKDLDVFRDSPTDRAYELIAGRRSIRRYTTDPVSDETIEKLLWAATCAPSAHNSQPWRFVVLRDFASKGRLAHAMGDRLRADRTQDNDNLDVIEADIARSYARIVGAPVAILVCLNTENTDTYRDAARRSAEHQMAVQGVAMAMQNIQLAATAAGLGSSIMCAPLFCQDAVRTTCALPSEWEPQALVTVGHPADTGKPFTRRSFSSVVHYLDVAK